MRAIIISGGYISPDFLKEELSCQTYGLLIAADRGLEPCYALSLEPDVLLGDFDSVRPEIYEYYKDTLGIKTYEYPERKDDTDTELAVRYAIEQGAESILLYGATGTRLDHTMANISLLRIGLLSNVLMELRDTNNRIRLITERFCLLKKEQFGTYISFLPMTECVEDICLTGFRYPLQHGCLTQGNSLGISNVLEADAGLISVGSGVLIMIESRD